MFCATTIFVLSNSEERDRERRIADVLGTLWAFSFRALKFK